MEDESGSDRKRKGVDVATKTPAAKRLNLDDTGKAPEVSPDEAPCKQFARTHQWEVDQNVWVKLFNTNDWVAGKVSSITGPVMINDKLYDYSIAVVCQDAENKWVAASTWHEQPYNIPKGLVDKYMRGQQWYESLPESERKQFRLMQLNMSRKPSVQHESDDMEIVDDGEEPTPSLDALLLGQWGREKNLTLKEQLLHLKNLPEVKETVARATGKEDPNLTIPILLSYMVGQFSGVELSDICDSRDDSK